jgi:hypothetical protein
VDERCCRLQWIGVLTCRTTSSPCPMAHGAWDNSSIQTHTRNHLCVPVTFVLWTNWSSESWRQVMLTLLVVILSLGFLYALAEDVVRSPRRSRR